MQRVPRGLRARNMSAFPSAAPAPATSVLANVFEKSKMNRVALNEAWPGLTVPTSTAALARAETPKVTTLPNGLRVVSVDSESAVSHVGVFFDSGSRNETNVSNGYSALLTGSLALKETSNMSELGIVREVQALGANIGASTSRELTSFTVDTLRPHASMGLAVVADTLLNSQFWKPDVQHAVEVFIAGQADAQNNHDAVLLDSLHEAAYGYNTLGLPVHGTEGSISHLVEQPELIAQFLEEALLSDPSRMVVSAVAVDHDELVTTTEQLFGGLEKVDISGSMLCTRNASKYHGGEVRTHDKKGQTGAVHVALGFEAASWHANEKDLIATCVLQMMMGGGDYFSAGGPGKGMYSRLYENVLSRHGWVQSANGFADICNDSGLFGITGTASARDAPRLVEVLVKEAAAMAGPVDDIELQRAKNQLKSTVMMQLENNFVMCEDVGRLFLLYNEYKGDTARRIDECTKEDVQRVAQKMLGSKLSLSATGETYSLPRYEEIAALLK
jgi:processing peptidase subunit alpha